MSKPRNGIGYCREMQFDKNRKSVKSYAFVF